METITINKDELEYSRLAGAEGKDIKFVSAPAHIAAVPPWSLAYEVGIEVGDQILEINGHKLRDLMDLQLQFGQSDLVELLLRRGDNEIIFEIEKDEDDELGVEFMTPLFNGVQECANKCPFCFIDNQPMDDTRETLHLRDDDFRLSYLHGSYVTLTNLSYSDRKRIEELRPGPLYVSVHATEPSVRNLMLGRKRSTPILEELAWLDSLAIPVHTQIVLCPEMNDGKHLLQSINELYSMRDQPVVSVAVVPVGLTKYHRNGLRRYTMDEALDVVNMVEAWEAEDPNRRNFVFLSDEWYLMTHSPVPNKDYYGDYPQLEDGVGMTRLFVDEIEKELERLNAQCSTLNVYPPEPRALSPEHSHKRISWINGTISEPIVKQIAQKINAAIPGVELRPICLESQFWGTTNVSGLLTGNDILNGLKYIAHETLGEAIIIPSVMLKDGEDVFLDDISLSELEAQLGLPCIKAWGAQELINTIRLNQ